MFRPEATSTACGVKRSACCTTYTCRPGHVAEGDGAPHQHRGQRQPLGCGGEVVSTNNTAASSAKMIFSARIGPVPVGQLAAPDVAHRHRHAIHQQHQAHGAGAEARHVLQDRREKRERDERAAVADGRLGIHQQQARLASTLHCCIERRRCRVADVFRHEDQATDEGDHTQRRYGEEGFAPAEMLTDERAQRHTRDQRHGEAGEHDCDRAGGFFACGTRLVAMVEPIEKNTPCARPVTMRASHQRFIARRLPGQQVAER
jgi:hypothetical protein